MKSYISICIALSLMACDADKDTDTGDTVDTGDTTDTGDDTGDDTGGDDTGDTGTSEFDLSFDIQGSFEGLSFSLVEMSLQNDEGDGPSFGLPMGEGPVESSVYELTVGVPDNLIEDADSGMSYKIYIPLLIQDINDNHIHDQNTERIVGMGPNVLMFIKDFPGGMYDDGFYYYDLRETMMSESDEMPPLTVAVNVPVETSLSPIENLSIGGTSTLSPTEARLSLVSSLDVELTNTDPLADIAVSTNWSLDIMGPPPVNHRFGANEDPFIEMAVELPIVYLDINGNEMRDADEAPASIVCRDDRSVSFMWFEDCYDLTKAFLYLGMGVSPGWHALYEDPDSEMLGETILPESEYTTLQIGEACAGDVIVNDADGDGWTEQDGDCDDSDASINPDAFDIPGDGVDQDCDSGDSNNPSDDQDADGFTDAQQGGTDCNDQDASINPGATEIPNDGIDQDCDGSDNPPSATTWQDVEPLLSGCTGCHGNAGGLTVNYSSLINGSHGPSGYSYVDPGSPSTSYLWLKLNNTQGSVTGGGGGVMPPSGMLPQPDLNTIQEWITEGALEQ